MVCDRCNCYFSFWAIFCHFSSLPAPPPLNCPKNQNFEKIKKSTGDIIILHMCTKLMIRWCMLPEIWCATDGQTDGRTDRQTKKVAYRGGYPHLKMIMKNKTKFTQNWFYQIIPSKQYLILSEHKNQGNYFMNQPDTMNKHAKFMQNFTIFSWP